MTTQLYREVKRKAAVGDRVRVFGHHDETQNTEHVVLSTKDNGHIYYEAGGRLPGGYVVLEPITPLSADPLYAAFRQFVVDNATAIRAVLPELENGITADKVRVSKSLTSTQRRAQVIAKATADVAKLIRKMSQGGRNFDGNYTFQQRMTTPKFHVNQEKRAVAVLVCNIENGAIVERATAKCSPSDVFHAEIGKAIALRKALGLTVPGEYTDAPQPERAEVGAVVSSNSSLGVVTLVKSARGGQPFNRADKTLEINTFSALGGTKILDDTDVDYSGDGHGCDIERTPRGYRLKPDDGRRAVLL